MNFFSKEGVAIGLNVNCPFSRLQERLNLSMTCKMGEQWRIKGRGPGPRKCQILNFFLREGERRNCVFFFIVETFDLSAYSPFLFHSIWPKRPIVMRQELLELLLP